MCKIVVYQGVPASGKSHTANEFVKGKKDWVIVNRDFIREATGEYWVPSREDYISEVEEFQVRSAIKNNLNVIIDATNLNPKTIEKWKNIASETNSEIEFKTFKIDFKTAIERDGKRPRPVGIKVLESFFSRYFPEELVKYYTDTRLIKTFDVNKRNCIICDLDGTLCIHNGRSPYNLSKVSEDLPNEPLLVLISNLSTIYPIIFLSGREGTEQCRKDTYNWLIEHMGAPMKRFGYDSWTLIMRTQKDYRPDEVIKEEIYHKDIEPNFNVVAVFDDRDKVVKMWRNLGLLCNQVYYGDF